MKSQLRACCQKNAPIWWPNFNNVIERACRKSAGVCFCLIQSHRGKNEKKRLEISECQYSTSGISKLVMYMQTVLMSETKSYIVSGNTLLRISKRRPLPMQRST